ncbi:MAG TPA: site-specific integrase [Myxococcaceae bacterium]|nr:site-specific integrase [Myxococcaceae bacterium]
MDAHWDAWGFHGNRTISRAEPNSTPERALELLLDKARLIYGERNWKSYAPAAERDNDSWATEKGRAKHLLRHLGNVQADRLTLKEVDAYRDARLKEKTVRGTPPTPGTLDREVELLKRLLGYAVTSGELKDHPLRGVRLLRKPNVRRMVLDEAGFQRLFAAAEEALRPMLLAAFDTGMRKEELLALQWEQVDLDAGTITLAPEETKTDEPRLILLTAGAKAAVAALHAPKVTGYVFRNPKVKTRWVDVKKRFLRAVKAAELPGLWFHDLRRSFITRARRVGVPESVVMRMSGHRARCSSGTTSSTPRTCERQCARSRALETRGKHRSPTTWEGSGASASSELRGPAFRAATNHVPRAGEFVTWIRNGPRSPAQADRLNGAPDPKSRLAGGLQPNLLNALVNETANGSGSGARHSHRRDRAAQVERLVDAAVDRFSPHRRDPQQRGAYAEFLALAPQDRGLGSDPRRQQSRASSTGSLPRCRACSARRADI